MVIDESRERGTVGKGGKSEWRRRLHWDYGGIWQDVDALQLSKADSSWSASRVKRAWFHIFVTCLCFLWENLLSNRREAVMDVTCFSLSVTSRRRRLSWDWAEGDIHLRHLPVWGRVRRGRRGCLVSLHTQAHPLMLQSAIFWPNPVRPAVLFWLFSACLNTKTAKHCSSSSHCWTPTEGLVHGWPFHLTSITRAGLGEREKILAYSGNPITILTGLGNVRPKMALSHTRKTSSVMRKRLP